MTCLIQVNAQNPVFVMSSIKSMGSSSSAISAINFKSNAACLDVQTGIVVLNGERNTGEFAINCEVKMKSTRVKFINTPPLTELFNISIWSTEGVIITTKKESGYNLFQGLTMDLSGLTPGSYVLKIESTGFVDAIKFIKAN